jgi:hypothetical protein
MLLGRQCGYRRGRAWVIMSQACNKRLRDAMYHCAREGYPAIQHDPVRGTAVGRCERVGSANGRALRTVSDRLLAVACSMLRERTPYDRQHRAGRSTAA